jgi:XTP/dITP diphosphohydrolase
MVSGLELLGYDGPEPIEDGSSFLENSLIKARAAFKHTGVSSIADDSGLAVEIMGGSPGIFSARWSGDKDDEKNRNLVLAQLRDVPSGSRAASFVCTISLVGESGEVSFTGVLPGHIAAEASGSNGFGYDPIFKPEGFDITFAQLSLEEKGAISHRGKATAALVAFLKK